MHPLTDQSLLFLPVYICVKCSLGCSSNRLHITPCAPLSSYALLCLLCGCPASINIKSKSGLDFIYDLWLKMSDHVWQTPARMDGLDQIACQTMIKSQSTRKRRWRVILLCELFQQKTQITLTAFAHQSIFKQSADKKLVNIKWFHPSSPVVNAAIFARELYSSSLCCSDETVWTPVKCSKVSPIRNFVVIHRQFSEFVIYLQQALWETRNHLLSLHAISLYTDSYL